MKVNSRQRKKRERNPNSSEFREGRKQKLMADFNNHNKRLRDTEKKLVITSKERGWGRGNIGAADKDIQNIMYKVSNKDILYNRRIQPIFYNYKWNTF